MKVSRKTYFVYFIIAALVCVLGSGIAFSYNFLKGAHFAATMTATKSAEASTTTFQDMYHALPGDMADPSLIEGCKIQTCVAGNEDGRIGEPVFAGMDLSETESFHFWRHLHAADLAVEGREVREDAFGAMIFPVYSDGKTSLPFAFSAKFPAPGHFFVWMKGRVIEEESSFLKPSYAQRLDAKLDDGLPLSGKVIAAGDRGCIKEEPDKAVVYNIDVKSHCLFLYVRM